MDITDTVVIGAGQAGLAVSHLLGRAGRDHVVLERGQVAEAWRSQRWDSLRLLTPRWMSRLPGWHYEGADPEGFMPSGELVRHLEQYAAISDAPIETERPVLEVATHRDGYRVRTEGRTWLARHVVVATGAAGRPRVPEAVRGLHPDVQVVTPLEYRNPEMLPPGGVLVVGASSSGAQIADELARAGRRVVLAVGSHTRLPRSYRGMDAYWWLEQTGRLSRTIDTCTDPVAARRAPSFQVVGRPPRDRRGPDLDLITLQDLGVELTGRLRSAAGHRVELGNDLPASARRADSWQEAFLASVDAYVEHHHLTGEVDPAHRPAPVRVGRTRTRLDLRAEGIGTVVLATGYRPDLPWLRVPVVGADGGVEQVRGATRAPGLYVVGQRFQHRRDSTSIDGAQHDARDVVSQLCADDTVALRALEIR